MTGTGGGRFSPDAKVTRAQFVTVAAKMYGADLEKYASRRSFSDVRRGSWYHKAVEWAYDVGLTAGVSGGRFAPDATVDRQQLAVFLCAYAKLAGVDLPDCADLSRYADRAEVAGWAHDAVGRAVAAGLIAGTGRDTLSPLTGATRAQLAVMIRAFCEKYLPDRPGGGDDPTDPATIVGSYFLVGGTCGSGSIYEMIGLTGKDAPAVLYVGLATDEYDKKAGAAVEFEWAGCAVDILTLDDLKTGAAADKIASADLVYVDGGSSRKLLARLFKYGADEFLRKAAANGTVMCGSSAGAICFGVYGTSGVGAERYANLKGIGGVDLVVCPHGKETDRVAEMRGLLKRDPTYVGVAVDHAALEIRDGQFRVWSDGDYVYDEPLGYRYRCEDGEIVCEDINSMEWRPISELFG